ncbi:beta-ketoacyl synthase N-terminal-like domain-containing protein [Paenibacillus sp. UMB4589-SE434]|uniref:type I polyketide synthase n=1 Tax=Paenibacillus sp. UMB4589-SE434 TaxID=3046314 RepID=UPI00254ADCFD|nr:beta-ketoacyl synthase N-terminal-like domain-containing protein [Paenibacillus sp. UMB4589-SE434]MDK8182714.1 beta-ketoacyl synthase N-terminal-like domain-containing protein [Paenibacillus sp. UMB4589-SE434]
MDHNNYQHIRDWFIQKIAGIKRYPHHDVDPERPFSYYGLDSQELVVLSGELENWIKQKVDPTLFWDYPSIDAVARYYAYGSLSHHLERQENRRFHREGGDIAVIGMGCRFPAANSIAEYWHNLKTGLDCIREIPTTRSPHFTQEGICYAGMVDDIEQFDNDAFCISPREAEEMDPQQRLLLEVVSEALEDAGITNEHLSGSRTGVFIGISSNDYGNSKLSDIHKSSIYRVTGNSTCIAANRISYIWNLRGPSMAVDTACSSSLVAIHLACQSLKTGESELAIAGGVNVILNPAISKAFFEAGMLAPDGKCKTFDAQANGYVRGEGAGAIILKPLSAAIRDKDRIYAVIRGSAVNQDGLSNGLTAPSMQAQEDVLKEAYRIAGVQSEHINYIEAHGTGTALGDPIEVQVLGRVLSINRSVRDKCYLGSVKSNIGHLEAAAGIAGFIKTVLCLTNKEWVPHLNFQSPNPYISFQDMPLQVVRERIPWSAQEKPALAGVSSFGFGGTNAHVVLQQYDLNTIKSERIEEASLYVLPLSANTRDGLMRLNVEMRNYLLDHSSVRLNDICYTAQQRRTHRLWRTAAIGGSTSELIEDLGRSDLNGTPLDASKLAFVFSGQGGQWSGMGRQLFNNENVFKQSFLSCDAIWIPYAGWSLEEELFRGHEDNWSDRTDVAQPLVFAVQVSLVALWSSWGIEPKAVIGHSLGEIAAYCTAGVLTLEDALWIVYWRSTLMQTTAGQGATASVHSTQCDQQQLLAQYPGLSVAAVNGPASFVIAGEKQEVEHCLQALPAANKTRMLSHVYGFHSKQMDSLCALLQAQLASVKHRLSRLRLYSTVTGRADNGLRTNAGHWSSNMRDPVLFCDAVTLAQQDGYEIFVEIGPHPVLIPHVGEITNDNLKAGLSLHSMKKNEERMTMLRSAMTLYEHGISLNWDNIGNSGECVFIPTRPWEKKRLWTDSPEVFPLETTENGAGLELVLSAEDSKDNARVQSILGALHEQDEVLPLLEQHLQQLFADTLKIVPADSLALDQSLIGLGMDSIMALQLKHKLDRQFHVSIPLFHFVEGATTRQAAVHIWHILQETQHQSVREESLLDNLLQSDSVEHDLGTLSDEEMDRLLHLLLEKGTES